MAFISTKWRPDHVTDSLSQSDGPQAKDDKKRQQFSHFDRVKITHCCLIKESWEKYIKTKQKAIPPIERISLVYLYLYSIGIVYIPMAYTYGLVYLYLYLNI